MIDGAQEAKKEVLDEATIDATHLYRRGGCGANRSG
jgi:hypothetical protein